jgi:hypothetical protein
LVEELLWTVDQMETILESADANVRAANKSVNAVERRRAKFASITDAELERRRQFVTTVPTKLASFRRTLAADRVVAAVRRAKSSSLTTTSASTPYSRLQAALEADNEEFVESQLAVQARHRADQDAGLTQLSYTVSNLKEIGSSISAELENQTRMIEELDSDVDATQGRMDSAVRAVDKILRDTADGKSWCAIIVLLLVLITLIVLAIQ